jgi:3-oxoacyl-[acyl-carrier protein] reductase
MDLRTAHVLVTGGSSGIGLAIARRLRADGAQVAISGRRSEALEAAARTIGAVPIVADVTKEDDVVRLVETAAREMGGYDTLINNAGVGRFGTLLNTTTDDLRTVYETNVFGMVWAARESARRFVAQRRGNIVNVASTAGARANAGSGVYASSKFAVRGLTEAWRAELRQHNVRVMLVNPSEVVTPFFETAGLGRREDNPTKLHPDEIAHVVANMLALDDRGLIIETSVWATNPQG